MTRNSSILLDLGENITFFILYIYEGFDVEFAGKQKPP